MPAPSTCFAGPRPVLPPRATRFGARIAVASGATPKTADFFGSALAIGDFDNDGFDDLAVGAFAKASARSDPPAPSTCFTAPRPVLPPPATRFRLRTPAASGAWQRRSSATPWLSATSTATASTTSRSARPARTSDRQERRGRQRALRLGVRSASAARDQFWHQNSRSVVGGDAESGDFFGSFLTVGDFNDDGFEDLVIGVPARTSVRIERAERSTCSSARQVALLPRRPVLVPERPRRARAVWTGRCVRVRAGVKPSFA